MTGIVLTWAILSILLTGVGLLGVGSGTLRLSPGWRLWLSLWLGWGTVLAGLQLWHLFWPVNHWALLAVGLLGLVGWVRSGSRTIRWLRHALAARGGTAIFLGLGILWIANRCMASTPGVGDDTLGYHLHAVRWNTQWPIVPGLGSLQSRLCFNNSSLLWPALLEIGPWRGRTIHLANGWPLAVMFVGVGAALASLLMQRPSPRVQRCYLALLGPAVMGVAVSRFELCPSSFDTDLTLAWVVMLVGWLILHWISSGPSSSLWLIILFFLGLMTTMKISAGVFAAICCLCLLMCLRQQLVAWRLYGIALLVLAFTVGVWLIRNIILTGYPLPPWDWLPLPVDWRMEPQLLEQIRLDIYRWAKGRPLFEQLSPGYRWWLLPWFKWQATRSPEMVLLPMGMMAAGSVWLWHTGQWARAWKQAWPLWAGLMAALLIWLLGAPEPRFGFGLVWMGAAALLAIVFTGAGRRCPDSVVLQATQASNSPCRFPAGARVWIAALILLCLMPLVHRCAAWVWLGDWRRLTETLVIGPGPDYGMHPVLEIPRSQQVNRWGVFMWVPVDPQMGLGDTPLPATEQLVPDLRLRKPDNLGGGFRMDRSPSAADSSDRSSVQH